ncbi:hypothetical protein GQ53DRAFT_749933 [Thozetella sp. PMI_491]|nr:hypothetical protein GQ53DRAFT_749933 [Thozetella sp. PMI_491]
MGEPDHLNPPTPPALELDAASPEELRILSRSPHPYHRQQFELLEPSDRLVYKPTTTSILAPAGARERRPRTFSKDSSPHSDSGTEADDEHFLKGLPAPRAKPRKGLRGKNEVFSGSSTPLPSPAGFEEEGRQTPLVLKREAFERDKRVVAEKTRRQKEVIRRFTELVLLACQGGLVLSNTEAQALARRYARELIATWSTVPLLAALYPLRVVAWEYWRGKPSRVIPLSIPASFDPAPILYPPVTPVLVAFLVAANVPAAILPNLVLSICSIPGPLVPSAVSGESHNALHWLLTFVPLAVYTTGPSHTEVQLPSECLALLYPLHQTLCGVLYYLTTTSLLNAELQLLSISLINVLLLASSPQVLILKALLWGGGISLIIFSGPVIRRGITLARVPKWRFKRAPPSSKQSALKLLQNALAFRQHKSSFLVPDSDDDGTDPNSSDMDYDSQVSGSPAPLHSKRRGSIGAAETIPTLPSSRPGVLGGLQGLSRKFGRRHTLPSMARNDSERTHTPSGRRKRSASSTVRPFFSLTYQQAQVRRWLYTGYLYVCILTIILVAIRWYVEKAVLSGNEPIGWALGYLFGDLPWFRFQVVKANLERWICLPSLEGNEHAESCYMGWVQHVRHASFGEANTRLLLSAYFFAVIIVGLAVVFQLSPIYEVDTRRKVFHFMMVAMFLPSVFIDPAFVALALSLMLAIFLLLDLLRASQLPPLSKPIAAFLTPYVDGRDLRGPVVISHIFLLIGCAIPLWLSLAAVPRIGAGYLTGWETPTRDVSMVSGIVCVGLGDAAASLIGRRWGHRKWLWGGGKSLEGSVAFGTAAFVGLFAASVWLKFGGWPATSAATDQASIWSFWYWTTTAKKTGICASMASLTEAVLTGGNDNVVVPVVLWTCVKGLAI